MSAGCFELYKMNEDHFPKSQVEVGKQGIVSILNNSSSDFNSNSKIVLPCHNSSNSIRRTLSADMMSSEKWLQNNGFPPHSSIKRVKSSLQFQDATTITTTTNNSNEDAQQGPAIEDIWSSIQADNKSWGCILSNNPNNDGSQVAAPYVHPLAKRTGSSLSEKSLEICTESLGSETGSDGFSYPPSDSEEEVEEEEEESIEVKHENNVQQIGVGINKVYNNYRVVGPTSKRSMMVPPTRPSFPPPLPSLGHRDDGSNLCIRSHRQDGRLVVEAVTVPSQNCFRAQRQDGRLLLTFSAATSADEDGDAETEEDVVDETVQVEQQDVIEDDDDDDDHEEGVVDNDNNNNKQMRPCTTLAMMTKFMELTNKSATWPRNYNTTVIKDEFQHEHALGIAVPMTKSLPPRPTKSSTATATATATALNAYEYYWRRSNSTTVGMLKPLANNSSTGVQNNIKKTTVGKHTKRNNNKLLYAAHSVKKEAALAPRNQLQHQQQNVSAAAAAEYVVPLMLRGCKEPKKPSLLLWEPYCIATS